MKLGNNGNLVLGLFDESTPCLMIVLMNCQIKLRINHLTAVKSVAILESNAVRFARKFKILYRWRGHREERDLELNEEEGGDQHGGAIGHGRMSGIVGEDSNKMVLIT
ncbi:alpha-2 adrenergic receptor [Trichonephila clavipes]|nr:alpha-2 adrenergic receptor [Trichonephila clavipes]